MSNNPLKIRLETNHGDITVELTPEKTPITVNNFLEYVKSSFYNKTLFHRVIPGFMIQGGGFKTDFTQKETNEAIENEARLGDKNVIGSIAMARTNQPHSATAQFFINVADNTFLNYQSDTPDGWGYCVFGQVTEGLDIVKAISTVATTHRQGHQDVPVEDVILEKAYVLEDASAEQPESETEQEAAE